MNTTMIPDFAFGRRSARWPWMASLLAGLGACALVVGCGKNGASPSLMATGLLATPVAALVPTGATEFEPALAQTTHAAPVAAESAPEPTPAAPAPPPPPKLSASAEELVQLAQAQVGDDVLLAYIESSTLPYDLHGPQIVYLTDLGVSAETIAAMVRRDQQLKAAVAETAVAEERQPAASEPAAQEILQSEVAVVEQVEAPAAVEGVSEGGQTVTHNYFYNSLAPYGTWLEVPDYGWCWQPTVAVVSSSWQPYSDGGRWLWTDAGWYWQSYYSWGWAPFHYGRWHLSSGRGWLWTPDNYWGPAWVTWRYSPGYCGWAPLPPGCGYRAGIGLTYYGRGVNFTFGFGLSSSCYAFVPTSHFYSARPWHHRVSGRTVNNFYGRTTVINNVIQGNNNTIINKGIGTETISAVTRTEIRRVRLSENAGTPGGTVVRGERLSRDGTTLAVHRPKLPTQSSTPPATLIQRQEQRRVNSSAVANSEAARSARVVAQERTGNGRALNAAGQTTASSATSASGPSRSPVSARSATSRPSDRPSATAVEGRASTSAAASPRTGVTRTETPRSAVSNPSSARPGSAVPGTRNAPRVTAPERRETPLATRSPEPRRATVVTSPVRTAPSSPTRVDTPRSGSLSRTPPPNSQPPAKRFESPRSPAPNFRSAPVTAPSPRLSTPLPRNEPQRQAPRISTPAPTPRSAPVASFRPSAAPSRPSFAPPAARSIAPTMRSAPAPRAAPSPSPSISRSAPGPARSGSSPARSEGRSRNR